MSLEALNHFRSTYGTRCGDMIYSHFWGPVMVEAVAVKGADKLPSGSDFLKNQTLADLKKAPKARKVPYMVSWAGGAAALRMNSYGEATALARLLLSKGISSSVTLSLEVK